MNIDALLKTLAFPGLSKKEALVYLASLEIKEPTALSVAKQTGLPRPSVYRVLDKLVEKGLMGEVVEGKKRVFVPEDPGEDRERYIFRSDSSRLAKHFRLRQSEPGSISG